MKRFIFGLLSVCIILSMSFTAFAQDEDFEVKDDNYLYRYKGSDSEVIIPDGIQAIGEEAFQNNRTITSVVIPDTVETIELAAFEHCSNLVDIVIPASVKYVSRSFRSYYQGN